MDIQVECGTVPTEKHEKLSQKVKDQMELCNRMTFIQNCNGTHSMFDDNRKSLMNQSRFSQYVDSVQNLTQRVDATNAQAQRRMSQHDVENNKMS